MSESKQPVDIVQVKYNIQRDLIRVVFHNGNILLKNAISGEAVKIGELPYELSFKCDDCIYYPKRRNGEKDT